tara:strand:- start:568 stop:3666 length:3099 start_codon:yes stop_codon:yes gene_type:complete
MSNLLGQPFKPWVTEQIDIRQKSLGKYTNIPDKDLQYYITKAPWIRLASSVNLNKSEVEGNSVLQKLISNGLTENQVGGDNLAKNLILQGGVLSATVGKNGEIISNGLNSGLNNGSSLFNGAYGWGGIEERGYVPMPGITNADVQYLNNGALTKTTINIRCFSKRQFQLIDVLYLRPGYTLLLEFGHSAYLDNDGKLQSFDKFSTSPLRTLLNPKGKTQYDIYREIETEKFNYKGNYDAVYGKISNFNWQFNPDGSYDCQVILTGMGDVIESLKMNVSLNTKPINISTGEEEEDTPGATPTNPIIANKDKTLLNEVLYEFYQKLLEPTTKKITKINVPPLLPSQDSDFRFFEQSATPNPSITPNFLSFTLNSSTSILVKPTVVSNFPNQDVQRNFKLYNLTIPNSLLSIPISTNNEETQSPQTYMTFGTLMAIVQSRLLLYNGDEETKIPIATIDMDFDNLDKDENFILKFPGEFSADPRVCVIPYTNTSQPIPDLEIPTSKINAVLNNISSWNVDGSLYLGRLAAIYVNINYIAKVLGELEPNEENQISILDFLQTLIKGITQSLGGFNKITVQSTIDGKIKFIEEIPQRFNKDAKEEFARFNVFGVKQNEGSFIKNINLTAEISNDFATMISIGAQSNGNQVSGNATSFSNYNAGLEDRIIPEKFSYQPPNPKEGAEKNKVNITSNWARLSGNAIPEIIGGEEINTEERKNLFTSIYNEKKFISENINSLTSFNTTHASLILGRLTQPGGDGKRQLQAPFFLPFNFSLEMEGLSGMILYQKFLISDEVLPPSYEGGGVEIQIKGINHSINTTAWTTKLDTLSTPAANNTLAEEATPYPLNTEIIKPTSCEIDFGDEQYRLIYPQNLKSYTFSGNDPREGLFFRGVDMRVYNILIEDGSGKKLPKAGYGVSRRLCEALVVIGEAIQKQQGDNFPTTFSSGYRSPVYNCTEGGLKNSMHKTGGAVDIFTGAGQNDNTESSLPVVLYKLILQLIIDGKIPQGGVGLYNSFVHYDIRGIVEDDGTPSRWDFRNK